MPRGRIKAQDATGERELPRPRGLAALSPERRREISQMGRQARRHPPEPERRREIARMGAFALHEKGLAYRWTSEQARAAGRKSVQVRRARKQARITAGTPQRNAHA